MAVSSSQYMVKEVPIWLKVLVKECHQIVLILSSLCSIQAETPLHYFGQGVCHGETC